MDQIRSVQLTAEFERIAALPRRKPGALPEGYQEALSALLRRPGGQMTLRPIQAWALAEIFAHRGLLGLIRVGHGKTLISLLAPVILSSKRPVLILPANLIGKTERERRALNQHWKLPNHLRLFSYEGLGRVAQAKVLEGYRPDLIILDEAHMVKNRRAAVTRRIARCFADRPETICIVLTGTITNKSLKEYQHLAMWALKPAGTPLPNVWSELEDWADTLDEAYTGERPMPGPLVAFCADRALARIGDIGELRRGYHRRLTETSGVVTSQDSRIPTSLFIRALRIPDSPIVTEAFRGARKWERPDGEKLVDGTEVWRLARELALGFFYRWDPAPPAPWREARREWGSLFRELLSENRRQLDSELAVKNALRAGYNPAAGAVLAKWEAIAPTFKPNSVPVWIDETALNLAAEWSRAHHGIIWTQHTAFAKRLAKHASLKYYGAEGLDRGGRYIEDHPKGSALIASTEANIKGRNLQFLTAENLETSPHPSASRWEQKIGRTHRELQPADLVTFDVFMGCAEHIAAWEKALARAQFVYDTTGQEQKILYADSEMNVSGFGPVWEKDWIENVKR